MRIIKRHSLLKPANNYVIDSPQPSNISYWWNIGSLLGLSLGIQIITGVTLAMHYNPNVLEAFNSVEHIMRDVNSGWLIRYLHANTASAFFFLVYLHIGRGLYYGSYKAPRSLTWTIGTTIFILMMATAFLGYVLPYGQMSLWGATVITNLMSAIPWIGQDIVEFVWGGFSVNNATLNRFFSLHFVLPFILAALALMHLIALHDSAGSNNPLGVSGNYDRVAFAPYFIFKDVITIFIFMWVLSLFVFFLPNFLGDSENYVMANPMQTPPAIVPEWYLLPFYAILRSIPNKLIGVIAMFSAILMILVMTFGDLSKLRGIEFKPLNKTVFFIFVGNLLFLMVLGAKHVESPFIEIGQIATLLYFFYFILTVPMGTIFENSLNEFYTNKINTKSLKSQAGFSNNLMLAVLIVLIGGYLSTAPKVISVILGYSFIVYPLIAGITSSIIYLFRVNWKAGEPSYKTSAIRFITGFMICLLTLLLYKHVVNPFQLGRDLFHENSETILSVISFLSGQIPNVCFSDIHGEIPATEGNGGSSGGSSGRSSLSGPIYPTNEVVPGLDNSGNPIGKIYILGPINELPTGKFLINSWGYITVNKGNLTLVEPIDNTRQSSSSILQAIKLSQNPARKSISLSQCGGDGSDLTRHIKQAAGANAFILHKKTNLTWELINNIRG